MTRFPSPFAAATLLLLLVAATAPLGAQQPPPDRPPIPHTDTTRIEVRHHPGEDVVELVIGPVELTDGMPHLRLPVQMAVMPTSGWLRGFDWEITDAAGRTLPDELLHHVNLVDPDHRQLFAPTPLRVLAAGRETRRAMLPPVVGIPFERGSRYMVSAMFANATGADYPDARLHVRIHYLDAGDRLVWPHSVRPFYLDVTGPVGDKDFAVPPGWTVKSWEGSPAVEARILGAGGHVHDYAEQIRLVDLTAGRVLWSAEPNAAERGRVFSVPEGRFWWRGGIPLRPDHRYRVQVVYHNPTDRPAPLGGMGVIGGVVLPADDAAWPELDRFHPAYCLDLMNHVTAPARLSGHARGGGEGAAGASGHDHGSSPGARPGYADAPCRAAFGPEAGSSTEGAVRRADASSPRPAGRERTH